MYLMEAFTTLYQASGKEVHARKLKEVIDLIFRHMVNCEKGYGLNQFDVEFRSLFRHQHSAYLECRARDQ